VADVVQQHRRHRTTASSNAIFDCCAGSYQVKCLEQSRRKIEIHEPIFFRSAQRFFKANDILLLPSGVRPLPCFPFTFIGRIDATVAFFTVPDEFAPSKAAIARASLSLSCLSSATIFSVSKFYLSFSLVDWLGGSGFYSGFYYIADLGHLQLVPKEGRPFSFCSGCSRRTSKQFIYSG
jgi:hypothetical protein